MSNQPSPSLTDSAKKRSWIEKHFPDGLPDDPNHPAQIALRTYAVSLALSLGPSLLPFVLAFFSGRKKTKGQARTLKHVLKRELGPNGFAFAITVAVGGGAALQRVWNVLDSSDEGNTDFGLFDANMPAITPNAPASTARHALKGLRRWIFSQDISPSRKAFVANLISSTLAIILLQGRGGRSRSQTLPLPSADIPLTLPIDSGTTRHGPSPTLDLTLLLLVRAIDAKIQSIVFKRSETYRSKSSTIDILGTNGEVLVRQAGTVESQKQKEEEIQWRQRMTTRIDAFFFWACSARSVICLRSSTQTNIFAVSHNKESCGVSSMSPEGKERER